MSKERSIFRRLLSFITYKEKEDYSFYIPKINEAATNPKRYHLYEPSSNKKRTKRNIIKPATASESAKRKKNSSSKACENSISTDIEHNISHIESSFNYPDNSDIIIRRLKVAGRYNAFIFYLDGMVDRVTINNSILKPLLDNGKYNHIEAECLLDFVFDNVIETNNLKKVFAQSDATTEILGGNTGIHIDGCSYYIICETKGFEKRSVDKPQVEGVVKGPQEAFTENLRTNITLVRRILKNRNLTVEFINIGDRNNGQCAILYLKGLINPVIVQEVTHRLKSIKTDFILGDGVLEQFIEGSPWSIIPTILSTERPDRTVSHIIEGKIAIISEGTPFALIAPITMADLLHTPEDTSLRWQYGTLLRLIRLFAVFVATLLPGLYVALTTFHREMIPTDLLIAIAKARENVPFPTILEVLLMEVSFELIREAGIRIPGIIGNTIGIIGALILGQAAVQANLVSPVLIIVIAFTGLGNFAIPDFSLAFAARIMRLIYIIFGAILGFYGISLGLVMSFAALTSQKSFGIPMFSILAPKTRRSNDVLLRMPLWKQELRPDYLNPLDITRQPKISRKWIKQKSASTKLSDKVRNEDNE